jgi:hypothetical protein
MQWQDSQIKTFTRWINGHIAIRGLKVESLETDLNDGVILINLLEILTGKSIEKYYKAPKNKTYMIANHTIALTFMGQQKLAVNCSAQDLADGRITMLMGFVWSLIRQFSFKVPDKQSSSKNELISWCKSMVEGYRNILFDGSMQSFQDGLVFCALLHKYDPSLLDYESLNPGDKIGNIRTAITIAESRLALPHLLDLSDAREDFFTDEQSLLTYLAEFYNIFQRKMLDFPKTPRTFVPDPEFISVSSEELVPKEIEARLVNLLLLSSSTARLRAEFSMYGSKHFRHF